MFCQGLEPSIVIDLTTHYLYLILSETTDDEVSPWARMSPSQMVDAMIRDDHEEADFCYRGI